MITFLPCRIPNASDTSAVFSAQTMKFNVFPPLMSPTARLDVLNHHSRLPHRSPPPVTRSPLGRVVALRVHLQLQGKRTNRVERVGMGQHPRPKVRRRRIRLLRMRFPIRRRRRPVQNRCKQFETHQWRLPDRKCENIARRNAQ